MASPGPPNHPNTTFPPPFDMQRFFNPASNPQTPQNPPLSSASLPIYPPPPSSSSSYPPSQNAPFPHPHYNQLQHQRSLSYQTPPLQPPLPPNVAVSNPNNAGARLMALLSGPQPSLESPPVASPLNAPIIPSAGIPLTNSGPLRMASSKMPKGRHLAGDHVVYDVGVRLQGEVQPQLEVTPITKYNSDPQLVFGRQIAVNRTYICYGLNQGNIRVLNINTALRHLLRGHTQRVTDMAFFAEDVHLLASASVDGRVYVWKISESSEEEDKPQISAKTVVAIQITGEGESVRPRVCWHCHKQEFLVIGIGTRVLRIDMTKIGKGHSSEEPLKCPVDRLVEGVQYVGKHDAEVTDLSMCQWMTSRLVSASMDGTIKIWEDRKALPLAVLRPHEGQPVNSATFLASPYRPDHIILITGGPLNREVKLWVSAGDEGWLLPSDAEAWKCMQTLELKSSADPRVDDAFFNQVVVLPQPGLLLLANSKKNAIYAAHLEYGPYPAATHIDYIAEFTVTMPILSFTGISDILPHGEHIVQVYCVQTQAIQQYALNLSQCLPLLQENGALEKSDSTTLHEATDSERVVTSDPHGSKATELTLDSSLSKQTIPVGGSGNSTALSYPGVSTSIETASSLDMTSPSMETKSFAPSPATSTADISCVAPSPSPPSPKLSRKVSDSRNPINGHASGPSVGDQQVTDYSVDRQVDAAHPNLSNMASLDDNSRNDEKKIVQGDLCSVLNAPTAFKRPTHLITPSEIFMAISSSETTSSVQGKSNRDANIQNVIVNNDIGNNELEVKVVNEAESTESVELNCQEEPQSLGSETKEKYFCSQASSIGFELGQERSAVLDENYIDGQQVGGTLLTDPLAQLLSNEVDLHESKKDVTGQFSDVGTSTTNPQMPVPSSKGKKQKGKPSQASVPSLPSPSVFDPTDSPNGPSGSSTLPQVTSVHFQSLQETLSQVVNMQKDMQKQMTMMVTVPVTKEGKRIESTIVRNMEKVIKANNDALWARFQEENSRNEKLLRECTQQITNLITNFMNKDLAAVLEKIVKKEMASFGQAAVRAVTPAIEKIVTSAVAESFQRGVGDKAVNQLEKSVNSKLEANLARQIQAQFQTSGKQALQETLKSSMEASLIPAFEKACKGMFEHVDAAFQKGMVEHTVAAQQHLESAHSQMVVALRDALNSAASLTQTLSGELADGQRKVLAFVAAGVSPSAVHPMVTMPLGSHHEKAEVPLDPTKELSRLLSERKYEEAFTGALQRSDVSIVSWLCSQVDLHGMLSMVPLPLSQGVLLSLLQQVACDINNDTTRKLSWMTDIAAAINPTDPRIAVHVRPIFEQVYQILNHQRTLPRTTGADMSSIRLLMHVINSMLMTHK